MNWILIAWIWAVCSFLFLLIFIIKWKSIDTKLWQSALVVLMAPLVIVGCLIYAAVELIKHIRQHGFHNILPRRKGKAYPLEKDEFGKYYPKDTVYDGDDKISIDEFNKKYCKCLTLDDVYGKGYCDAITPEEYFECHVCLSGKYGKEPNLPETDYTQAAETIAKAMTSSDFSSFESLLSENPYLILYLKESINGKASVIDYFRNWVRKAQRDNVNFRVCVKWNVSRCRPAVYLHPDGYAEQVILINITAGKISNLTLTPVKLRKANLKLTNLDEPSLNVNYAAAYLKEDEATEEQHLICPICGTDSALLDWYSFEMADDEHVPEEKQIGVRGVLSICPTCAKVVEVMPQALIPIDSILPDPFHNTIKPALVPFAPKLRGLHTFETNDSQMDCYPWDERAALKDKLLAEYRATGNVETGNNAAIFISNHDNSDDAISLFMELADKGCQNAMANLFSVFWANMMAYDKAADWLLQIETRNDASLLCLWNLAVMCYSGKLLYGNPLSQNLGKAKELLLRIQKLGAASDDETGQRIIADTQKFLDSFDNINLLSASGAEIHRVIKESIVKTQDLKDKGELFFHAKSIQPKAGLKLGLKLAGENNPQFLGDESAFYFYDSNGKDVKFSSDCLNVEPTEMGAWQLYLLATAPTIMPVVWHGGYICRNFIFMQDDLNEIINFDGNNPIGRYDFSTLDADGLLLPKVVLSTDGSYADVYCCYWNDWQGLVREHVRVTFTPDGSASMSEPDHFTFYKYDCGILF